MNCLAQGPAHSESSETDHFLLSFPQPLLGVPPRNASLVGQTRLWRCPGHCLGVGAGGCLVDIQKTTLTCFFSSHHFSPPPLSPALVPAPFPESPPHTHTHTYPAWLSLPPLTPSSAVVLALPKACFLHPSFFMPSPGSTSLFAY